MRARVTIVTSDPTAVEIVTPAEEAERYRLPTVGLQLTGTECQQLEALVGLGASQTGSLLLAATERLASLRFGDIRIPFSPGQLVELQHRAAKRGRTIEAEMRAVVDRIEDELFYKGV